MVVTAQTNYPAFSTDSEEGPRDRIQYVGVLYAVWITGLGKKLNPRRIHSEGLMYIIIISSKFLVVQICNCIFDDVTHGGIRRWFLKTDSQETQKLFS